MKALFFQYSLMATIFLKLTSLPNNAQISDTSREVIIEDIIVECNRSSINKLCNSKINISVINLTDKPQRYLMVRINLYEKKGKKINDPCLSGIEMIDLGKNLSPNDKRKVTVLYRKYRTYAAAKLVGSKWYNSMPSYDIEPEAKNQCP